MKSPDGRVKEVSLFLQGNLEASKVWFNEQLSAKGDFFHEEINCKAAALRNVVSSDANPLKKFQRNSRCDQFSSFFTEFRSGAENQWEKETKRPSHFSSLCVASLTLTNSPESVKRDVTFRAETDKVSKPSVFVGSISDALSEPGQPTLAQLVRHPIAIFAFVPKSTAMFFAGAISGALAKTTTAPLDRVKLLMQVQGVQGGEAGKKALGITEAVLKIGKDGGIGGYWKGNLPQVLRVIPYSAVQLLAYDSYKKLFQGKGKQLSVPARLAAGACAGMTSTLVTYPLDVLRLRLAVDPACKSMGKVAVSMLRDEGVGSFYRGLGPSLLGIAPYIALNFCIFDLLKKWTPEEWKGHSMASFLPAFLSAGLATLSCYPLDTVRRQLQMKSTPYKNVMEAIPGIIASQGIPGLYRGFLANALKNLPNSSIRLGTYDAAKNLLSLSEKEFNRLVEERRKEASFTNSLTPQQRQEESSQEHDGKDGSPAAGKEEK